MVTGLLYKSVLAWPLYVSFPATIASALVASVLVSLSTPRTGDDTLLRFYVQVNPWGFWSKFGRMAVDKALLTEEESNSRFWEKTNDAIAICLSVPFQLSLLLGGMAFIFHDWQKFSLFTIFGALSGLGLYFFWYKNLKSVERCAEEDAHYGRYTSVSKVD